MRRPYPSSWHPGLFTLKQNEYARIKKESARKVKSIKLLTQTSGGPGWVGGAAEACQRVESKRKEGEKAERIEERMGLLAVTPIPLVLPEDLC